MVERDIEKGDILMAHWLYCQSCKQWSKSPTPLSDDKVCPFCNNFLVKVKSISNPAVAGGSAEKAGEVQEKDSAGAVDKTAEYTVADSAVQPPAAEAEATLDPVEDEPKVKSRIPKAGALAEFVKEPEIKVQKPEVEISAESVEEEPKVKSRIPKAKALAELVKEPEIKVQEPEVEVSAESSEEEPEIKAQALEAEVAVELVLDEPKAKAQEPEAEISVESGEEESEVKAQDTEVKDSAEPAGEEPKFTLRKPDERPGQAVIPEIKFLSDRKESSKKLSKVEAPVVDEETPESELGVEPEAVENAAGDVEIVEEAEQIEEGDGIEAEPGASAAEAETIDEAEETSEVDEADEAEDTDDGEETDPQEREPEPTVKVKEKKSEPETVKVSEVRVLTDRTNKKDRSIKKTRR